MAESNDEPPLCPCGFWGSAQTSGLCSKCYKLQQQKKELETKLLVPTASSAICQAASAAKSAESACKVPEVVVASDVTPASNVEDASSSSRDGESGEASDSAPSVDSPSRPVQKNKKRCFTCKARLELAFVEIGRCRCGYTFCELHRLPEQHECTYNHKEIGRKEAREKMVSPKKHVGTSLRRLDSDT